MDVIYYRAKTVYCQEKAMFHREGRTVHSPGTQAPFSRERQKLPGKIYKG